MKKFNSLAQSLFVLSIPFIIFLKPENFIEMIGTEILYLIFLLFGLFLITFIVSILLNYFFSKKISKISTNDFIFILGVIFFEIFYHEKIRDWLNTSFNVETILSFFLSLLIIFSLNCLTVIILIKHIHKLKINILIFMTLLVAVIHYNNFNLYKSTIESRKDFSFFKKSDLPKKKLNKNIYLIILDEMTNLDDFTRQFPEETKYISKFRKKLSAEGLVVLDKSLSAYNLTYLNLTGLINANYFIDEDSPKYVSRNSFFPNSIFYKTKNTIQVLDYLSKHNHFMEMIGNSEMNFELIPSTKNLKLNNGTILFPNIFYKFFEPTFIDELFRRFVQDYLTKSGDSIYIKNNGMGVLENKIGNRVNKGIFFVHHFSPHAPYLFDRNCKKLPYNKNLSPKKYIPALYKDSYICVTKKILKLISKIKKFDDNAIVLFQGDHSNSRDRNIIERFYIFNAILVPDNCRESINKEITNINTFRLALYCSSNEIPILYKNNSYIGFHGDEKKYGKLIKIK
jgi:hypothetical protein